MTNVDSNSTANGSTAEKVWWAGFLSATVANCLFQILWFWRFRSRNITMDGIAYIGLARHLVDGNWRASLHGYWSPLTSWIIAAGSVFTSNFTLLGRLVTIASFLLCLPLLYYLTVNLWNSRAAASFAVFWFSVSRGVVAMAVGSILADFVLTACVLLYFLSLLNALRQGSARTWLMLGASQALAFLAKAIAMPWLSISDALALALRNGRSPRKLVISTCLVFLVPGLVWLSWGSVLGHKYGAFTTGYQLRGNLMINWNRHLSHRERGDSLAFTETPSLYDEYMVSEPWPSVKAFSLRNPVLPTLIVEAELKNLPRALKEFVILLTPAGALAVLAMLIVLIRNRQRYRPEAAFTCITALSVLALIAAYCMLVFDDRYLIPVTPVVIAICCPLLLPARLVPAAPHVPTAWQRAGLVLFAASVAFFTVYWASPLRTVDRDFEQSCYQAGDVLRASRPSGTLVSVGDGPYPEHGVGFEVGPYVAYLSGWRLVGGNSGLPATSQIDELEAKILSQQANAVAVWGSNSDPAYVYLVQKLESKPGLRIGGVLTDSHKGEVGTVFLSSEAASAVPGHGGI